MKKKHRTTKNTTAKPPVTRLLVIGVECNGRFNIVTEFTEKEFNSIFREWFDHPDTFMWCDKSLLAYVNAKYPNKICLLEKDYRAAIKGQAVINATKEEWEQENN